MDISKNEIKACLDLIESKINWGSTEGWTTRDFQELSERIYEEAAVTLSVATLKRVWGKVAYSSKPAGTTLDALAKFVGYENWRTFEQTRANVEPQIIEEKKPIENSRRGMSSLAKLGILGSLLFLLGWTQFKISEVPFEPLNHTDYTFSSKMMVWQGLPNSVLFDYDAIAADDRDTVYIQQSWDERLRTEVSKTEKNHNSIYYYPGYFDAKLVVRDTIVQQHDVFIKTDGWLPLIDVGLKTPVYFTEQEAIRDDGSMYISEEQIRAKNIIMQPEVPSVHYFYMSDMDSISFENMIFETRLKNTYKEGAGACQFANVDLRFAGAFFRVPLSAKGCVSEISVYDEDGVKPDPTKLGVDFDDWVNLKLVMKEGLGELYIDGNFVYDINMTFARDKILKGVEYKFQGGGMVDNVSIKDLDGTVFFEEQF